MKVLTSALALAGALALGAGTAFAQAPNDPPARFAGTVTIDGAPAPAGTTVTAQVGSATCGVTTVFSQGGAMNYVVDVAPNNTENPGCGAVGSTVTLLVNGATAGTGSWLNYQLNQVNLSVGSQATATPTATTTATTTATATSTPRAPQTGSGQAADGSGDASTVVLGLGAAAIAAGAGLAIRRRAQEKQR
ncbi:MAG: hypothetical protein IT303_05910 [Dehalococcoidia bacterium]|nr:hypothetical protein [Dehalococcoidia bacterium]